MLLFAEADTSIPLLVESTSFDTGGTQLNEISSTLACPGFWIHLLPEIAYRIAIPAFLLVPRIAHAGCIIF